jgi:hypothetical protein
MTTDRTTVAHDAASADTPTPEGDTPETSSKKVFESPTFRSIGRIEDITAGGGCIGGIGCS